MKLNKGLIALILMLASTSLYANEKDLQNSAKIMDGIIGVCATRGMLECRPNIQGLDDVFRFVEVLEQVSMLEKELAAFVEDHYPNTGGLDFDVMQASLKLSLDVSFKPESFISKARSATKTGEGYNVVWGDGLILKLVKNAEGQWLAVFPPEANKQFSQLRPFFLAAQLKRSILLYRANEAQIAKLSKDELENNISQDLAPVVVAVLGKERVPGIVKWLTKDLSEVIQFYSQFSSIQQMRDHIIKTHKLAS